MSDSCELKPGLLDTEPFERSRTYAARYDCDLALASNYLGLGSLVCFTPLVEAMARRLGRPIRLLTTSYDTYGKTDPHPIWLHNPYVGEIVDADAIDPNINWDLMREAHNFCQCGHITENLLAEYGLKPRRLRGTIYLSEEEQRRAFECLSHLPRPLLCLNPHGYSAPLPPSPWYQERWLELIERLKGRVGMFMIGFEEGTRKEMPVFQPDTTIREMMGLIWAADAYVGFDGGPSHIAPAVETPAVVLWDAVRKVALEEEKNPGFATAMMNRWAWPQNLNLMILGERHSEILDRIIDHLDGLFASQGWRLGLMR